MSVIDRLLSKSPFSILEEMMKEINLVIDKLPLLFQLVKNNESDKLIELANAISESEGKIDDIKRKIRNNISKTLFLPISKRDFIDLVLTMDGIPDRIESLAKTITLRELNCPETLHVKIEKILVLNKEINKLLSEIVLNEVSNLMESSFSGPTVQRVMEITEKISTKSYNLELEIQLALKEVFKCEQDLHPSEVLLWTKVLEQLELVTHSQEKTGNTFRRILEH